MKRLALILCLALPLVAHAAPASTDSLRKASTVTAFRKAHACPATGKVQSTCPGYVVDHIVPLCAGGPDSVDNMMWQTKADSYRKDVLERDICRRLTSCKAVK